MLQAYKLCKNYDSRVALRDMSLQLSKGETLVVMGPSGCGKSTLLRCLNRLIEADSGEIWFRGQSVMDLEGNQLLEYRRKIGFVFQHFNLIPHFSALENVILGPVAGGIDPETARDEALGALKRVGLEDRAGAFPADLSGGERQRVAIARALAMKPEVIFWDEPTAALDPIMVDEVLVIMSELAQDHDTAMIVVTHEIPFALNVADRLLLMQDGQVVAEGDPWEVLFDSPNEVSRRYRRLYELRYGGYVGKQAVHLSRNVGAKSRTDLEWDNGIKWLPGVQAPRRPGEVLHT